MLEICRFLQFSQVNFSEILFDIEGERLKFYVIGTRKS
jgi:hypothetical protein